MKVKHIINVYGKEVYIKSDKALELYYQARGNRDCPVREVKNFKELIKEW